MRQQQGTRATGKGLLHATGIVAQLNAACATLTASDPEMVRGMMLSFAITEGDESVEAALRRAAEEQCVEAEVERRGACVVIKLRRKGEETAK
jgi:hypothetical protein